MTHIALLIATCLIGAQPAQVKPDRIADCWEITNSEWDRETFTFTRNGVFTHDCRDSGSVKSDRGTWDLAGTTITLRDKKGAVLQKVRFDAGDSVHTDSLVFSRDSIAERSYWVAEQRLIGRINESSDAVRYQEKGGAGFRVGFWDGKNPHFYVDLWPMEKSDIERLKKLVVASLQKQGIKPVHQIRYDIRGF